MVLAYLSLYSNDSIINLLKSGCQIKIGAHNKSISEIPVESTLNTYNLKNDTNDYKKIFCKKYDKCIQVFWFIL